MAPVQPLITLPQTGRMNRRVRLFCGQDKYVNVVFAAPINKHGNVPAAQNVQAPANQGKTIFGKIFDGRSEVELAAEPGLDGVLIGGSNVGEVTGLERANMGVDELSSRERGGAAAPIALRRGQAYQEIAATTRSAAAAG